MQGLWHSQAEEERGVGAGGTAGGEKGVGKGGEGDGDGWVMGHGENKKREVMMAWGVC